MSGAAAERARPGPVPPAVRRLALPWWRARVLRLAGSLERHPEGAADGAGFDGRWRSTGWLAEAAQAADKLVVRMQAEKAAGTGGRVAP